VDFPCVPATATSFLLFAIAASASGYVKTSIHNSQASNNSLLFFGIASV